MAKRSFLGKTLLIAAISFTQPVIAFESDTFHGNNFRDGRIARGAPESLSGVAWQFDAGAEITTAPLVVANTIFIGTRAGFLFALPEQSGRVKSSRLSRHPVEPAGFGSAPSATGCNHLSDQ